MENTNNLKDIRCVVRPEGHVVLKRVQELVKVRKSRAGLLQHRAARQHDLFEPRGGGPAISGDSVLGGKVVAEGPAGGTVGNKIRSGAGRIGR